MNVLVVSRDAWYLRMCDVFNFLLGNMCDQVGSNPPAQ